MSNINSQEKKSSSKKRTQILDGALTVFTENGFDNSSMDKIAEVAGVSKITIYKHFQNKEALFLAIISDYLAENKDYKPITYSPLEPIDFQLKAFIEAEIYRVADPRLRGLSKLLTSVYLYKPELVKQTMQQNPFFTDFITWLDCASADGKLNYNDPIMAAQIFYGMIHGCITWNALLTDGDSLSTSGHLANEIITTFKARFSNP
ncbi:MAG: TetR/AcrR family transcriptional regulator, regulator of autoinduction and epiphytic fitness [Eubacteriaceae bacterium]|jgi:TetR/AcrR family transcriptional regulator of autoinduction and epiphytic fitness|nr:TetR/AcrR family transcriptional regulator, regulator of autoinduction and epiphytic fitness [Eubacteriaceae bacterium]MDN5307405.1 TetR/AcrR family transcriptional regulator, regulator of autoinduction and epiphytic fitness [Eubacteriaceae bacterium]